MSTDIGSMIVSSPEIRHGRPCIAGTGITVHRIALWYKLGHSPEEIARRYGHGKRASSAVKTEELHQVGKRPAGPLAFDFHGTFAGIPA